MSRIRPETNDKPLAAKIIERIIPKYGYMPDIYMRLASLPEIKRFKNVGTMPEQTPHENAVAYAKRERLQLYVGYIILPSFDIVTHSFCVSDKGVVEPTRNIKWLPQTLYVGRRVKSSEIKDFEYLHRFNRLFI